MSVPIVSLVAIGVGLEGVGINDSFVVYQLVLFLLWKREQFIGVRIPNNVVGVDDLCLSWLEEGSFYFVFDILTHDVIVELGLALAVETEPSHLTLHVSLISGIPIIFGTPTHKFFNVLVLAQLRGEVPEVIPQVWVGLPLVLQEDDRVCVVVEDTFLQLLQGGIEFEPGVTGGETGYKDVKVG